MVTVVVAVSDGNRFLGEVGGRGHRLPRSIGHQDRADLTQAAGLLLQKLVQ